MTTTPTHTPYLSDKAYDALKFLALVLLPALGTLYFALAAIWGLPAAEQVVGTIVAVDTFLGVFLGISTSSYNKSDARFIGTMNVVQQGEDKATKFDITSDPTSFEHAKEVVFKVVEPEILPPVNEDPTP